jgi:hypothetical protein
VITGRRVPAQTGKDSFANGSDSFRKSIKSVVTFSQRFTILSYGELITRAHSGGDTVALLLNHELHSPGGDLTQDVCNRLLTEDEARRLREGTADDSMIREAMFQRLLPSMLEAAVARFHAGAGRGILLWSQDSSVHYVPEPQLTTALEIAPEARRDILAIVRQYCPESEAVILSERRHELELVQLGPGRKRRSLGTRPRGT